MTGLMARVAGRAGHASCQAFPAPRQACSQSAHVWSRGCCSASEQRGLHAQKHLALLLSQYATESPAGQHCHIDLLLFKSYIIVHSTTYHIGNTHCWAFGCPRFLPPQATPPWTHLCMSLCWDFDGSHFAHRCFIALSFSLEGGLCFYLFIFFNIFYFLVRADIQYYVSFRCTAP